ncbi:MAG TPA: hypothetical protein VFA04_01545 [Bryobacteraceae bacterium]|nr:hypothetical protein [Bryobacteraceae bacterium]
MSIRFVLLVLGFAVAAGAAGTEATVHGWVLDSACAYTKGLSKPISPECAVACAKKGSPLVILADDGSIYLPIADQMPAVGQNDRLMPYAGKRVSATGKTYERSGGRAIVLEKIEAAR